METTGLPSMIHISEATAQRLEQRNKSNWLTPRNDKIVAKGKGELQTYWAEPRSTTTTNSSVSSPTRSSSTKRHNNESGDWEKTRKRLAERYPLELHSEE